VTAFNGRVALVTGAGSGIGRVIALAFASRGAAVVAADIDEPGVVETVRQVEAAGGRALLVVADVTDEADVERMVASTVATFGRLDFASNNAGIEGPRGTVAELPKDGWERVLAVNLTGTFLCMRAELREMVAQGSGAIVNTASAAGLVGAPQMAPYAASKSGIIGLTRTAAVEVASLGVRVNAVAPGLVDAGLTDHAPREFIKAVTAASPIGRMARAEEIAAAVLWLCSDESSFVVGQTLPVDGGLTAI
jgi:NAD(P)-dependent dehydrogenase (short-subunit alcohol dehydrogenase family)